MACLQLKKKKCTKANLTKAQLEDKREIENIGKV